MKKSIFLITMLLFAGILSASAQWSSSGNNMGVAGAANTTVEKQTIGFYCIGGSLSFVNLSGDYFDSNMKGHTTGTINLARLGFFLGNNIPVYWGFGWDIPFKGWTETVKVNGKESVATYHTVGYRFPVYIGYRYPITESFRIYAHTGLNFDIDFVGYWGDRTYDGETEKLSGLDDQFNIFNCSWMLSAGIMYKKVYLGVDYALPFTDIFNHEHVADEITGKLGSFNISLGLCFDINTKVR